MNNELRIYKDRNFEVKNYYYHNKDYTIKISKLKIFVVSRGKSRGCSNIYEEELKVNNLIVFSQIITDVLLSYSCVCSALDPL